ncbi:MAG TPA: MFS transporter [Flavitalea sp.]|nr:MFS transporter [Flavitalea sp.]
MTFTPSEKLTPSELERGLKLVVKDGLATEAMASLTGGTFLVAMALYLGASNIQIGFLAAMPLFANVFQLLAIWLVQKYNNRRAISIICSIVARFPLFVIAMLPFAFSGGTSLKILIFLLFLHYAGGAVVGASWNSWMKDLVPANRLGSYFSQRTRKIQVLNVTLSLVVALVLDHIKINYPSYEMVAYSVMFLVGGAIGMLAVVLLSRTPEPKSVKMEGQFFKLILQPMKNRNFRNLVVFNTAWAFALNMATPFFSVYMLKDLGLPISYIITLNILSQLFGILFVKFWGRYADQFSNKTVIAICAPIYILCLVGWSFTSMSSISIPLLVIIHVLMGVSNSGISLGINNIGLKLAPQKDGIVYIAAKNMVTAFIPALAPVIGGLLADFFSNHELRWNISWNGPGGLSELQVLRLSNWNFFFAIGSLLALLSLQLLKNVREEGEIDRVIVRGQMINQLKAKIKEGSQLKNLWPLSGGRENRA